MRYIYLLTLSLALFACQKKDLKPEAYSYNSHGNKKPKPGTTTPFYFSNCNSPSVSGNFIAGTPVNLSLTIFYENCPGGSYANYSSATVNGITLQTPAATLPTGGGTITFSATGTPINPGSYTIPITILGASCNVAITVLNSTPTSACTDPGSTIGSTGCVTFNYSGMEFTHSTVRASDGLIWLQQNLGSGRVAIASDDDYAFGHYFQWGRWDDSHQRQVSQYTTGGPGLNNPSHIPNGDPRFIIGNDASTQWWGTGGSSTDTWSGITASATNGKDPCVALGPGWRLPTAAEWSNVINTELIFDQTSALNSNLKLTASGYKSATNNNVVSYMVGGYYWSSTSDAGANAKVFIFDESYNAFIASAPRAYGFNCRCVK